ncbi:hypothetical protein ACLKMY_36545 [Paraburkholderia mimosarum]|uniref:transposase n=1 Tax=Paraburkholderia mimosarum TaxID=312026 RepID=UPI000407795C
MAKRGRRAHSPAFEAKVALAALNGDKTLAELAQQYDVRSNQITDWKEQLQERVADVFETGKAAASEPVVDARERFVKPSAQQGGVAERKAMIDRAHALPIAQQARLVGIARSSVYNQPQPVSKTDLKLMCRIDELNLEFPFGGARMLACLLRREGNKVGRRHLGTLMKRMGVETLYRKPNTSRGDKQHKIWPYLRR